MKVKKQIVLFFIFIFLGLTTCSGDNKDSNNVRETLIPPTIKGQEAIDSPYIQVGGSITKTDIPGETREQGDMIGDLRLK
ncbi:MAG: hypothetical protein ABII18_03300 [bacterium]|nr:hypothetical protein [bacterium]